jgi:hypothetical protein
VQRSFPFWGLEHQMEPKADLDDMEKLQFWILSGLNLRPPSCPDRSHPLYQPSNHDSKCNYRQ